MLELCGGIHLSSCDQINRHVADSARCYRCIHADFHARVPFRVQYGDTLPSILRFRFEVRPRIVPAVDVGVHGRIRKVIANANVTTQFSAVGCCSRSACGLGQWLLRAMHEYAMMDAQSSVGLLPCDLLPSRTYPLGEQWTDWWFVQVCPFGVMSCAPSA